MKRLALLLFVLTGLFTSCKKSGGGDSVSPVDPRDSMVGSYSVNGTLQFEVNNAAFDPLVTSGTITVSKPGSATASTNQLVLTVDFPDLKDQYNVQLTGSRYVATDRKNEVFSIFNNSFTAPIVPSGEFTDKNEITFTSRAEAQGNFTAIKRRSVTGTKK